MAIIGALGAARSALKRARGGEGPSGNHLDPTVDDSVRKRPRLDEQVGNPPEDFAGDDCDYGAQSPVVEVARVAWSRDEISAGGLNTVFYPDSSHQTTNCLDMFWWFGWSLPVNRTQLWQQMNFKKGQATDSPTGTLNLASHFVKKMDTGTFYHAKQRRKKGPKAGSRKGKKPESNKGSWILLSDVLMRQLAAAGTDNAAAIRALWLSEFYTEGKHPGSKNPGRWKTRLRQVVRNVCLAGYRTWATAWETLRVKPGVGLVCHDGFDMPEVLRQALSSMTEALSQPLEEVCGADGDFMVPLYVNLCVATGGSAWEYYWTPHRAHDTFREACCFLGLGSSRENFPALDLSEREMGECYEHGMSSVVSLAMFLCQRNLRLRDGCKAHVVDVWASKTAGWLSGALMETVCHQVVKRVSFDKAHPHRVVLAGSYGDAGNTAYRGDATGKNPKELWAAVIMVYVRGQDLRVATKDDLAHEKAKPWSWTRKTPLAARR